MELQLMQRIILFSSIVIIIAYKYLLKIRTGNKQFESKDMLMVNSDIQGVLLYVKQREQYLLVMINIVFKYSVQIANFGSNLVQKDLETTNSMIQ